MATLRDVARKAGVSIGSASAVINNTAPVSPEMRERVLRAVDELGYVPDAVARSLKMGRTRTIGLVLPDITNPHFAGLAGAIERFCEATGYVVLLCITSDDPAKELRYLQLLRTQRVDGLILVPGGADTDYVEAIRKAIRVPTVLVDRRLDGLDADAIVLDNRAAGRAVVEYLIRSGHRRIGMVAGQARIPMANERVAGYREALEDNGIVYDPSLVVWGEFHSEPARRAMFDLLHRRPRPTAIFSTNNHTTIGVMQALADQGFRVPADISVAAIDDFPWSTAFSPRLTTAIQPIEEMGRAAAERLLGRLAGTIEGTGETIVLKPRLAVRDSARPIEMV